MKITSSRALLFASILVYGICQAQPGFYAGSEEPVFGPGIGLLLIGWFAIGSGAGFSWLANPVLFLVWSFAWSGKRTVALVAAVVALLLMLSFPMVGWVITSAVGTLHEVTGYGLGYWLWVVSAVLALLSAIAIEVSEK